jgi:murein DD-endopeptidase MepM/ murein hydrolase activator NlpD
MSIRITSLPVPPPVSTLFGPMRKLAIRADHPLSANSPVKTHHLNDGTFGYTGGKNSNGTPRFHAGLDLVAGIGTPVYAVAPGRIEWIRKGASGYGDCLLQSFRWRDGKVYFAFFAHLSHIDVKEHQDVNPRSSSIAQTGVSGLPLVLDKNSPHAPHSCSSHPHLHFEIRISSVKYLADGRVSRVDPRLFLGPIAFQQNTIDFLLRKQEQTQHIA